MNMFDVAIYEINMYPFLSGILPDVVKDFVSNLIREIRKSVFG